jgi:KaiC/GvpD/RAD55 family RecA-like ATPase
MERLKDWLLDDEVPMESWIDDGNTAVAQKQQGTSVSMDSDSEDLEAVIEQLRKTNSDLRSRLEEVTNGLPGDQGTILRKEMELMELEERLRERESMMDQPLSTGGGPQELEERFQEELREKDADFRKLETEFNSRIDALEKELEEKESEGRIKDEELRIARLNAPQIDEEYKQKFEEIQKKEKFIDHLQGEVENLKAELVQKDEELKKISELLKFKDSEFGQREEDLLYRERKLEEERRRLEEAKKEASGLEELEMKKRLELLKEEVQAKEEEIRNKEKYLNAKENELKRREQNIIEEEIEAREEERAIEIQQSKVKTGNRRLDDLLLGGIPFGSNILVHGPPFTGKEVMIGQFVSEGLTKGVPCIWVLTDKTPSDIRREMQMIISGYEEYEKLDLVKYVDTYSMSMGQTTEDPYTVFIEDPTDHKGLMEAIEKETKSFVDKGHQYYRLAFRSLSTLIAYSDPISTFRFLSPFCGKRKRDKAVSMFAMEKGMHGDQEIQMIGSVMDGMIDFKVDQLKTYFAVKGITDVQSRSYIRYTATKSSLSIGSFSLDHIR